LARTMLREIWVIDDSKSVRSALGAALGAGGLAVRLFDCGQSCLAALAEAQDTFFVIDHTMPGMDGLAVVQQVRAAWPQAPIVAITGRGSEALTGLYREAGVLAMLRKPVDSEDLLALVRAAMAGADK